MIRVMLYTYLPEMLRGQCSGNLVWKALIFWFDLDLIPSFSFLMLTNNRIVVLVYSVVLRTVPVFLLLSFFPFFSTAARFVCGWEGRCRCVRASGSVGGEASQPERVAPPDIFVAICAPAPGGGGASSPCRRLPAPVTEGPGCWFAGGACRQPRGRPCLSVGSGWAGAASRRVPRD
jgi:hypothetical protein